MTPHDLVEQLAVPHRMRGAFWKLLALGPEALPAIRQALHHPSDAVRTYVCRYLDHYVVPELLGELIALLDDPAADVRASALHALACDRCKEGSCRPDEALVLPKAMALMVSDPDAHVRAHAVGVVGQAVHSRPEAIDALMAVIRSDLSPAVRKKARWYVPGGPIYRRTAPRPMRRAA